MSMSNNEANIYPTVGATGIEPAKSSRAPCERSTDELRPETCCILSFFLKL